MWSAVLILKETHLQESTFKNTIWQICQSCQTEVKINAFFYSFCRTLSQEQNWESSTWCRKWASLVSWLVPRWVKVTSLKRFEIFYLEFLENSLSFFSFVTFHFQRPKLFQVVIISSSSGFLKVLQSFFLFLNWA